MNRILFMITPLVILMLAYRPVTSRTISGKVTDEKRKPIAGASVMVKGTKIGTSTSDDGTYSLTVADANATLVFSSVDFKTIEIKVNGKTVVDATLSAVEKEMSEVVVTTSAIKRQKREISYSNQMLKAVPGIQISGSGSPGLPGNFDREGYDNITDNRFLKVTDNPLSTFSIDVDAASYSNVRRILNSGQLPPAGAIRVEEMINYFKYDYPQPEADQPFSINTEISDAPWNKDHKLVLIGLQGKEIVTKNLPASNLVFLIDVSGSMQGADRIDLVKASMKMLVDQLREQDKVAIVVYAGAAGLVLPPTSGFEKTKIKDAIDRLNAGGSTAGGAGIRLAYKTAKEYFVKGGNNRVILCTDGDFNVGESSDDAMERLIEEERKSGVFLTVLGYGMGNYQDSKMQKLADKGNGNHAYIDGISEAKKVLVSEFGGTLFTIAKDVKLQVEFNPAKVQGYRLIGYENRMLAKEDFNNDKKDAGELGSGHTVTALYEVIPAGIKDTFLTSVDLLKYQENVTRRSKRSSHSDEIMTIKFRYKKPDEDISKLIEYPVYDKQVLIAGTSDNFRFAAAVAEFGMLLRNSEFKSNASFDNVTGMAKKAKGDDKEGYRSEFIRLVENAVAITKASKKETPVEGVVKIVPAEKK